MSSVPKKITDFLAPKKLRGKGGKGGKSEEDPKLAELRSEFSKSIFSPNIVKRYVRNKSLNKLFINVNKFKQDNKLESLAEPFAPIDNARRRSILLIEELFTKEGRTEENYRKVIENLQPYISIKKIPTDTYNFLEFEKDVNIKEGDEDEKEDEEEEEDEDEENNSDGDDDDYEDDEGDGDGDGGDEDEDEEQVAAAAAELLKNMKSGKKGTDAKLKTKQETIVAEEEAIKALTEGSLRLKIKENEQKEVPITVLPDKLSTIPEDRLSVEYKTPAQLISDINFFFKNYSTLLTTESRMYKKINKKNLIQLKEIHSRITGKLYSPEMTGSKSKIGIIIDADQYISDKINQLLLSKTMSSLKPEDFLVNVGKSKGDDPNAKEFGSYKVVSNRNGKLNAEKTPVYRSIPSEGNIFINKKESNSKMHLSLLKPQQRNQVTTANMFVKSNPFMRETKNKRLTNLL